MDQQGMGSRFPGASSENGLMQNETITEKDVPMVSVEVQDQLAIVEHSYIRRDEQNETYLQSFPNIVTTSAMYIDLTVPSSPRHTEKAATPSSFPFVKSSQLLPFWESLDSVSLFSLLPQQPHFRLLEKYSEKLREGMALGCMSTLADLVEETRTTSLHEPSSSLEDNLLVLNDLEKLGFTVHPIRLWLQELVKIKDNYRRLKDDSEAAEKELLKEKYEKQELEGKIKEIQRTIYERKKILKSARMEKEMKEYNLAQFKRRRDEFRQSIQEINVHFDGLVAAPS